MKRHIQVFAILGAILMINSSCEDKRLRTFTANVPIYMSYDDLRTEVEAEAPREIMKPGKIYFKDQYIYINEFMEGVHIVDISDLSAPATVAYIPIPGNIDMAIKDDILYLDSYTDLVLMDISDPENPAEHRRIEDVLEYTLPPYDEEFPVAQIDEDKGVVTGWEVKEHTEEIETYPHWPVYWEYTSSRMTTDATSSGGGGGGPAGSAYGVGGSMARFLTYDDYLYTLLSTNRLKVFSISSKENAVQVYDKYVGWGLETMFIYDGHMYLGARDGMYILSLENPDEPYTKSIYSHLTSCDPVVVRGNTAYVTLRSGTTCGGTADLLEVIDISDKFNPEMISSFAMEEPYGLGISGNTLFVCQGEHGLFVYDASDNDNITSNKIATFSDIHAKDVIPLENSLFTIGDEGFYIYDYTDLQDITLLSSIEISEEE